MISAKVICDSISPEGIRLTTFKLRYPKFIHGEFMTHRVISRNASSSRAIPTAKLIEEVRSDALRAGPVFWGKNQPGMGAREELDDYPPGPMRLGVPYNSPKMEAQIAWTRAAMNAAHEAEKMMQIGAAKEIVNRLLEPFSHINVVATAIEWDNFFGLRLHQSAQPEMRALAIAMWEARKAGTPKLLKPGEWHLPFVSDEDQYMIIQSVIDAEWPENTIDDRTLEICQQVSVARCARVSYMSFETGKRSTVEEDLKLYERLVGAQPLHASPAEHQATPDSDVDQPGYMGPSGWQHTHQWGNFRGWRQYRKMLPNEAIAPIPEEFCPGHVASDHDSKICGRCGIHIDSLRLPEGEYDEQ